MNPALVTPLTLAQAFTKVAFLALILTGLMMQGCASYTKWKVDAVEPSRKGVTVQSVSIAPFAGEGHEIGTNFARLLAGHLEKQNFVEIRQQGAQGQIVGSLDGTAVKIETWREKYKIDGKTHYRYYAKNRKSLTASYTLSAGGQTWSGTYSEEYSDKENSRDSYSAAKAELQSEDNIRRRLMNTLASRIAEDITPFRVRKTYKLKLGDTDNLELGADYAKLGRQEQAMSIFQQVAERTDNNEDRAAALYNIGVILEIRGDFDQAFEKYRSASQFHLEELMYPKAITRLENEIKRRAVVDKQIEALSQ